MSEEIKTEHEIYDIKKNSQMKSKLNSNESALKEKESSPNSIILSTEFKKAFNTKIKHESHEYVFSINCSDRILEVYLYKENDIDKFKNYFTYERLLKRSISLGRITDNLFEATEKIFNCVKEGQYLLKVNFAKSFLTLTIIFDFIKQQREPNPMNDLEIFLYKTDSRQYDSKIDSLKVVIDKLNEENETFREQNQKDLLLLENLVQDNLLLQAQYNELYETITTKTELSIEKLREEQENQLEEAELRLKKVKLDLTNGVSNPKLIKATLHAYLPIIMFTEKDELLKKWFKSEFELVLAYDSIVDGDDSTTFHNKCDGKMQTLTLIETMQGRRFGGYTKLYWDHSENFKSDDEGAFIFSIDKKTKINCSDQTKVIYCSNNQGPTFGKGPDIFISNKFLSKESSSCIRGSYGEKDDIDNRYSNKTFLAGIEIFNTRRVEVYQVIFK